MPSLRRAKPAPFSADRTIVASAARFNLTDKAETEKARTRSSQNLPQQEEAWSYYDGIGEIKYAYNLAANVTSRIRLYVGVIVDPDAPPVPAMQAIPDEETPAEEARGDEGESLANEADDALEERDVDPELARRADEAFRKQFSRTSVPTLMRNASLNINVTGECLMVLDNDRWTARSTSEVRVDPSGRSYVVQRSRNEAIGMTRLGDQATVGRVWRQHPRFTMDPDSAMFSVRNECEELLLLGRMIRSTARSRLNAGALYIPDEVSVAAKTYDDDGSIESEEEGDPLERELVASLTDPVSSEAAASTVVPLLLRGPADLADKIKHITFERKSDEFLVERADRVLERILQGIDMPKDVVTGLANVKYSNAMQIDEGMYKAHIEPMALLICDAVTEIVLHPTLRAMGFTNEQVSQFVVWYDPSEITTKTDRTEDADNGYANYLINGAAWRDAHGFGDTDAPDEEEIARRLAIEKATIPPEVATELYNRLMPSIMEAARAANGGQLPADLRSFLSGGPKEPAATEQVASPEVPPTIDQSVTSEEAQTAPEAQEQPA